MVGLGVTSGHGSKTRSKIFSLASNHQFTHFDFTSGGVIPGKIPLHSHVCTGEFTQTGVTLTVFFRVFSENFHIFNLETEGRLSSRKGLSLWMEKDELEWSDIFVVFIELFPGQY